MAFDELLPDELDSLAGLFEPESFDPALLLPESALPDSLAGLDEPESLLPESDEPDSFEAGASEVLEADRLSLR